MEIKIKETGKIETLEIIDPVSGCDWASDLTGDDDNIIAGEDCRECDQETFDWWSDVLCRYQKAEDRYHGLLDDLDDEKRELLMSEARDISVDVENYPESLQDLCDEYDK